MSAALPKVVIIDDDLPLAQALARSFERRGYEARIGHDISAALKIVEDFKPSFGVIDLRLGGASGLEVVKALRAADSDICLVVLTGYASITTAVEAIKLGAGHYLTKPANVEDIIKAFGRVEGRTDVALTNAPTSLKNLEWERIHEVLTDCDYNISEAARRLGMHRRTLARKLEKQRVK